MFEKEQQLIEEKIKAYCDANNIALAELKWQPIPFSGEWGTSTSFFQTAANEARAGKGNKVPVPRRAQELAEQVKVQIGSVDGVSHNALWMKYSPHTRTLGGVRQKANGSWSNTASPTPITHSTSGITGQRSWANRLHG